MDKNILSAYIVEIEKSLDRVVTTLEYLKAKLKSEEKFQCKCDVSYTGTHQWPCQARK